MIIIKRFSIILHQALAAFAVWIVAVQIGLLCMWSSPYLAKLTSPGSPLPLTLDEASWIASLICAGRLIGAVIGATAVSRCGSKKATLLSAVPLALGWILKYIAYSPLWLYVARVSLGIGYGCVYNSFALYLGEVAAPEIRGVVVSFAMMGASFGDLLVAATGANMSLKASSVTYFVPCVLAIVLLAVLPDSPYNLVKIGNFEAAKKSVVWYRGEEKVDDDLREITKFVQATSASSFMEKLAQFKMRHIRKATILVVMLFIFMQVSGMNTVLFYMEIILTNADVNVIKPSTAVTYSLILALIAGISCIGLYDKCGRKIIMIVSCIGAAVSHTMLGTHFVLQQRNYVWIGSQWLPIIAVFLFTIFFTIGLNAIPSVVSSEIYAANIKSIAACIANITAAVSAFVIVKSYQPLVDLFGEAYVLYAHAFFIILGVPYTIFFMPETKGKSLQQIQDDLIRK